MPCSDLVLKNWLLNPTGRPDSFVPLDLVQEHGNLWIKTIYSAQGSNASWSWLSVISPCVEPLRALARDLNNTLGSYLGVKHTSPDISMDIQKIMVSLERHNVYKLQPGRTFNGKDEPVPDIETLGLTKLLDGCPSGLEEYNKLFKASQDLLRQPRVSQMVSHTTLPRTPQEAASNSTAERSVRSTSNDVEQPQDRATTAEDDEISETETDDDLVVSEEDEDKLVEALKAAEEEDGDDELEWKSTDSESDVAEDED
ncbi:hypothetical protein FRC09_014015 [Ceratobasidium sp. 395]|nr:hypothetical protein FRC09_014015 [Ceratobasidium sp. 395]